MRVWPDEANRYRYSDQACSIEHDLTFPAYAGSLPVIYPLTKAYFGSFRFLRELLVDEQGKPGAFTASSIKRSPRTLILSQ